MKAAGIHPRQRKAKNLRVKEDQEVGHHHLDCPDVGQGHQVLVEDLGLETDIQEGQDLIVGIDEGQGRLTEEGGKGQ